MNKIPQKSKEKILSLIDGVVQKYLKKALVSSSSNSANPFIMALFDEFEPLMHNIHGAKTSLGGEMEKIAEIIAIDVWGKENVRRKFNVKVELPTNVFRAVDTIINGLSNSKNKSNYSEEKEKILQACKNADSEMEAHPYEFDMELYDTQEKHWYYLEMKGPDPNTTEVPGAKKRLLAEMAWAYYTKKYKNVDAIFAIYYNNTFPNIYKNPKVLGYFNPQGGLLVHDAFWNFIGKSDTTYEELVSIFKEYGDKNKKQIWDGFSKLVNKSKNS